MHRVHAGLDLEGRAEVLALVVGEHRDASRHGSAKQPLRSAGPPPPPRAVVGKVRHVRAGHTAAAAGPRSRGRRARTGPERSRRDGSVRRSSRRGTTAPSTERSGTADSSGRPSVLTRPNVGDRCAVGAASANHLRRAGRSVPGAVPWNDAARRRAHGRANRPGARGPDLHEASGAPRRADHIHCTKHQKSNEPRRRADQPRRPSRRRAGSRPAERGSRRNSEDIAERRGTRGPTEPRQGRSRRADERSRRTGSARRAGRSEPSGYGLTALAAGRPDVRGSSRSTSRSRSHAARSASRTGGSGETACATG